MINPQGAIYDAEEGGLVPALSDAGDMPVTGPSEQSYQWRYRQVEVGRQWEDNLVGTRLLPTTPIMR